jgi:branched-chain amino acid transport system permease protein
MTSGPLVLEAALLGVMIGGVYALMASGLTLIFGVMRVINVGQGAMVILGAYLSLVLLRLWGLDPFVGLLITVPAMFLVGVAIEVVFIRPLRTDREALSVLVTYALALGIEGILGYGFTTDYQQLSVPYDTATVAVGGLHFTYVSIAGFVLCLTILGALFLILFRTRFGAAVRATMLHRSAAALVGIDVERVSAVAFGLGVATAAAGGVVFGITNSFNPDSHYDLISRLLAIVVLGGLGSLRGAIVGAVVLLVVENVVAVLISPTWANFAFFAVLVLVLLARPQGLGSLGLRERA